MNTKKIWFCFVTKDNRYIASKLVESIENQIKKFKTSEVNLLLIDKSTLHKKLSFNMKLFQKVIYCNLEDISRLEEKYKATYQSLNYDLNRDSIQRARLQLYIAFKEFESEFKDAIVWQLDDDMLLGETVCSKEGVIFCSKRDYCQIIRDYHKLYPAIDAAIGYCSYVPPLPSLLYLAKQLEEFVGSREQDHYGFPYKDWGYHDLYDSDNNSVRIHYQDHYKTTLDDIFLGKPSHPILSVGEKPLLTKPKVSLLRGGNFIVFNSQILTALPHIAFSFEGVISRRSDMLHAWMLRQLGFNIFSIDLSIIHNRSFGRVNFSNKIKAYFEDLLGAVAFRYITQSPDKAYKRFQYHKKHLLYLKELLLTVSNRYSSKHIKEFITALDNAIIKLASLGWGELYQKLEVFQAKALSYLSINSIQK